MSSHSISRSASYRSLFSAAFAKLKLSFNCAYSALQVASSLSKPRNAFTDAICERMSNVALAAIPSNWACRLFVECAFKLISSAAEVSHAVTNRSTQASKSHSKAVRRVFTDGTFGFHGTAHSLVMIRGIPSRFADERTLAPHLLDAIRTISVGTMATDLNCSSSIT